jgi:phosphatidylglycerophosphate synthase
MAEPLSYEQTLKPEAVETALDRLFFRPAAHFLVLACMPTPVGANALTLLGALVGVAGASLLRFTSRTNLLVGALLLLASAILDCADGQLARARGTASRFGRIVDGVGDLAVTLALTVALALHLHAHAQGAWLAVAGMASALVQWLVFDLVKNRFLERSASAFREGNDALETHAALAVSGPLGPAGGERALLRAYALYLGVQALVARALPTPAPDESGVLVYAQRLSPLLRVAAFLGPSTHAALLLIFALADALPAYLWLRLGVGNVLLIGLIFAIAQRERALAEELRTPPPLSGLL